MPNKKVKQGALPANPQAPGEQEGTELPTPAVEPELCHP